MKFRFVRKTEGRVKTYQGQTVATGEEIEFTGHFINKALANPEFEAVQQTQPASKKKAASKKKVAAKTEQEETAE